MSAGQFSIWTWRIGWVVVFAVMGHSLSEAKPARAYSGNWSIAIGLAILLVVILTAIYRLTRPLYKALRRAWWQGRGQPVRPDPVRSHSAETP
jgi:hypothetical protein